LTTAVKEGNEEKNRILGVIDTLFASIKLRDAVTAEHSLIMARISFRLALIHDRTNAGMYYVGSLTHDIGKLAMPDTILKGNQLLNYGEREILRQHVTDGVDMLTQLRMPKLVIDIARYHHERFDGSGYLEGLKGKDIPLAGRIAAVSDTYATLVTGRPYQSKKEHKEAINIMENERELFDPDIFESFLQIATGIEKGLIE
jgi:putative two-component system response regulator